MHGEQCCQIASITVLSHYSVAGFGKNAIAMASHCDSAKIAIAGALHVAASVSDKMESGEKLHRQQQHDWCSSF